MREMHGLPDGLEGIWITDLAASSPLVDEGIQPGDVIVEVNGEPVGDSDEFEKAIGEVESGRFARLYVMRAGPDGVGQPFFAVVRVP
jgi:S1-C subfamily serine protease